MPACFIISGFLFQKAYVNDNKTNKKRIYSHAIDFLIVYVLFCVLLWIFKLLFSGSVNSQVGLRDILFIWCKPMPTYWYLYVLIILYVFFSFNVVHRINKDFLLFILLLVSLLSELVPSGIPFQLKRIMFYAFFFYVGMLKCKKNEYKLFSRILINITIAVSVLLAVVCLLNGRTINSTPVINVVVAVGISLMVWKMAECIDRNKNKAINIIKQCNKFLGINMLEIYVIYCFVAAAVRIFLIKLGLDNIILCIGINLCTSLMLPVLCNYIMKKIKVHDYIFRMCSKSILFKGR